MKKFALKLEHGTHALALSHLLSNRIGKAFALELAQDNISVSEWRVILTLVLNERASGQEITNQWAMEKMSVNRAITSLERRGLIEKKENKTDRRKIDLLLTTSGRFLYDKLLPAAKQRYKRIMSCLSTKEAEVFNQLLTKMIAHVDEIID